ncbi:major facilitator superfamily domain-containing protein [Phascolomyces articulosus]|uniref:Major facilitator superfamily domain-containing protein n=1 Tax=Phascolomyces articulosus TaxID=60185 RepID=A0AAD5JVR1_9FUNG|nr:major facilitator superfamily domain-containing protein [Phascolomyces articulosus]
MTENNNNKELSNHPIIQREDELTYQQLPDHNSRLDIQQDEGEEEEKIDNASPNTTNEINKEQDLSDTSTLDRESITSHKKETMTDQMTAYDDEKCRGQERSHQRWLTFILGDIYAKDDPSIMSDQRRNIIILIVALGGVSGPLASMIYMPGLLSVANDLNTNISAVNGSVSAYVVFMGVAPLIWGNFSDQYGRKRMYFFSNLLSLIASIICAISTNIGMLIVFRAFQSCGANAGLTLGAGVIADIIPISMRGKAYGLFYIGPLVGPVLGPTIGGFLCQYLGWQSTFYLQAILSGLLLMMTTMFLPETLRKTKNDKISLEGKDSHHFNFSRVFQNLARDFKPMFLMLRDWSILHITAYHSVIFGCLYFLNPTITSTLHKLYGYNAWQVGLCYLPLGFGFMIGSVLSGKHSDIALSKTKENNTGKKSKRQIPEMRLMASVPAFFFIPAGYLIYGWTTEKGVGVYAPLIGLFVYALGQMWAFTPTSVYLVDSKPGSSATAVGIANAARSIVGAVTAIFSTNAVESIGPGILFTVMAVINIVNVLFVVLTYYFGEKWRMDFETKVLHRTSLTTTVASSGKPTTETGNDIEASLGGIPEKGTHPLDSTILTEKEEQEHMDNLYLARITSKHSAV